MKNCIVGIIALLFSITCPAQTITAREVLDKLSCTDTACFSRFLHAKGYMNIKPVEQIGKDFFKYSYRLKTNSCSGLPDSLNFETIIIITTGSKIYQFSINLSCKQTYDILLGDFKKRGFTQIADDEVVITYSSKKLRGWQLTVLGDLNATHRGIYFIRLDKISGLFNTN